MSYKLRKPERPAASEMDGASESRQRVALYVRVSTEEQAAHGFSIAGQIERLEAYALSQRWQVLPPYVDDGYSGKDLNRPAMQRLLADAKQKKFDLLLVFKIDRISRNVGDLIKLGEHLNSIGVGLRSATEPFDTTNSSGKLLFNMLGSFAQFERELIGERTRLGLRRRKREGKWNGIAPFGYRTKEDGTLELDPREAPFARRVFQLFLENNWGTTQIARHMRLEDHVTRRNRGRWVTQTVWKMLSHPVYAGLSEVEGELKAQNPAIVTWEEFERVQKVLASRASTTGPQLHSPNVLSGLLRCGLCGGAMTTAKGCGKTGKLRVYYYMCRGKDRGCRLEYIPAKAIETSVINEIREIAAHPELIDRYLKQRAAETERANSSLMRERTSLQRKVEGATRAKEGKVKWLIEAMPEKSVAAEIGREIQKQVEGIDSLKTRLAEIESKIQENRASRAKSDVVARLLKQFVDCFDSMETTQKRLLLQHLVKEVVVKGRNDARAIFLLPIEGDFKGDLPSSSHPPARDSDGGFLDGSRHHEVPLGLLARGQMTPLHQNWGDRGDLNPRPPRSQRGALTS
jgi:site-specific DNA recombinase